MAADTADTTIFDADNVDLVAPEHQTEATAMLQLALGKDGVLRGTYHDLLANADHPIHGAVDKATQQAAWTFGPHTKVTFQTALPVLTEPSGAATRATP
jgi:hypothetical protein